MGKSGGSNNHYNPQQQGEKKKKITPVQIAFLVERYLVDNNYAATLSTFRSEAAGVFSRTKGKDAPKGLLGLGDILDDYITLKEQKLIVDQEKRRVDALLQGIHDAVRLYHTSSSGPTTPPLLVSANNSRTSLAAAGGFANSSPLSPPMGTPSTVNRLQSMTNVATGSSPPGNNLTPNVHATRPMPPVLPHDACESVGFSSLVANSSSKKKRIIKQLPQAPPAPKKSRPSSNSLVIGGIRLPSQVSEAGSCIEVAKEIPMAEPAGPCEQLAAKPSGELVSSVAKSLFKLPTDAQVKLSSPKTPPQESPSQSGESISPADPSQHPQFSVANVTQENMVSTCSVVSSKKIVVISPFKQSGYYSVKRSHHISTSPLKSSPGKLGCKRDHVKSRLDFDSEVTLSSEKFVELQTTSSSNEGNIADDIFSIDLFDLDEDISFPDLFGDFDLEPNLNLTSGPSANCGLESVIGPTGNEAGDATGVLGQYSYSHDMKGLLSEKETNIHDLDSTHSVEVATKFITLASPAKNTGNLSSQ